MYKKINKEEWPQAYNYFNCASPADKLPKLRENLDEVPVAFINVMKRELPGIVDTMYKALDHEADHLYANHPDASDWMVETMEAEINGHLTAIIFEFAAEFGLLIDDKEINV